MLKERYIWSSAVALAIVLAAGAVEIDRSVSRSVLELHERYQTQALGRVEEQIRSLLDQALADLTAMGGLPEVQALEISEAPALLSAQIRAARVRGLKEVLVFASDGRLLLDLPPGGVRETSNAFLRMTKGQADWAARIAASGGARIHVRREPIEGLLLELLAPIPDGAGKGGSERSGKVKGALVSVTSLEPLAQRWLKSLALAPSSQTLLVEEDRVLSTYPQDLLETIGEDKGLLRWIRSVLRLRADPGSRGGVELMEWRFGGGRPQEREAALVHWRGLRVGQKAWLLVTATPRKELLLGRGAYAGDHTLSSLVLAGMVIGLAAFVVRTQRKRVKLLREVAFEQDRARKVGEQAWQSGLLSEIVRHLRAAVDLVSVGEAAVQTLGRALDVSRCVLYAPEGGKVYAIHAQFVAEAVAPAGAGLPEAILPEELSSSVVLDDFEGSPVEGWTRELGLSSLVLAPVARTRRDPAVLALHQCGPRRAWRESELQLVERVAAQLGTAMDQAELYAEQVRAAEARSGVLELAHAVSTAREAEEVARRAMRMSVPLLGCRRGLLLVRQADAEGGRWSVGAAHGLNGSEARVGAWVDKEGKLHPDLEEALGRRQVVRLGTGAGDGRVPPEPLRRLGLESLLVVPLPSGDEVLGLFVFEWAASEEPLDELDTTIAGDIARHTAAALKNAQLFEALHASETRYQDLYDHAPDMYQTIDAEGVLLDCNETECRLLGFDKEEIIGSSFSELLTPESIETWRGALPCLFDEGLLRDVSLRLTTKEGQPMDVALNASVIRGGDGAVEAARAVLRDVTRVKELEQQLRQSQKMELIGTLASGVAHDFNNLLGGIVGYTTLLRSELEARGEAARFREAIEHLETIERSAIRGSELTSKLLAAGKRATTRSEPVDLNRIVQETTELLARTINKSIRIEKRLDAGLPSVLGDASQLQQVVLNLCVNARDAMPSGGLLLVETEHLEDSGRIRLGVEDTGVGMDARTLERVFEPFFSTKGASGTGLGLAVVYGIVQSHGGDVRVESTPGKGTRFEMLFPAHHVREAMEEPAVVEPVRGTGQRILLVDDEEMLRRLGRDILGRFGYEVELAESGEEALDIVQRRRREIALVILDLIMPGLGGAETCRRLKTLAPELPVLISSGLSEDATAQSAVSGGACGFLAKPFNLAQLTRAVSEALEGGGAPSPKATGASN